MNNLLIWPIALPLLATLAVVVWPRRSDQIGLAASLAVLLAVVLVLQRIAAQATNADGKKVSPVAWDCGCLEEVCGACTMVVNTLVFLVNNYLSFWHDWPGVPALLAEDDPLLGDACL